MRIFRLPFVFRIFYPGAIFRIGNVEKTVYLTFDDGPERGVTEKILSILKREQARATFFCSASSVEKYPELFNQIKKEGAGAANHGYLHIKGWRTGNNRYIENVKKGFGITGSTLFRPPFGSLGLRQFYLLRREFKIVFWDLILYDFDTTFKPEEILLVLEKKIRPGSIIVLHDNAKSSSPEILTGIIGIIRRLGYRLGDLENEMKNIMKF